MSQVTDSRSAAPDPLRVLIVEDDRPAAEAIGLLVEALGYDFLIALTAGQALLTAEPYRPDIALINLNLPDMHGFTLCAELRSLPGLEGMRCIAQTGWDRDDYRHGARASGFDHFMVKPLTLAALKAVLTGFRA